MALGADLAAQHGAETAPSRHSPACARRGTCSCLLICSPGRSTLARDLAAAPADQAEIGAPSCRRRNWPRRTSAAASPGSVSTMRRHRASVAIVTMFWPGGVAGGVAAQQEDDVVVDHRLERRPACRGAWSPRPPPSDRRQCAHTQATNRPASISAGELEARGCAARPRHSAVVTPPAPRRCRRRGHRRRPAPPRSSPAARRKSPLALIPLTRSGPMTPTGSFTRADHSLDVGGIGGGPASVASSARTGCAASVSTPAARQLPPQRQEARRRHGGPPAGCAGRAAGPPLRPAAHARAGLLGRIGSAQMLQQPQHRERDDRHRRGPGATIRLFAIVAPP